MLYISYVRSPGATTELMYDAFSCSYLPKFPSKYYETRLISNENRCVTAKKTTICISVKRTFFIDLHDFVAHM